MKTSLIEWVTRLLKRDMNDFRASKEEKKKIYEEVRKNTKESVRS